MSGLFPGDEAVGEISWCVEWSKGLIRLCEFRVGKGRKLRNGVVNNVLPQQYPHQVLASRPAHTKLTLCGTVVWPLVCWNTLQFSICMFFSRIRGESSPDQKGAVVCRRHLIRETGWPTYRDKGQQNSGRGSVFRICNNWVTSWTESVLPSF